MKFILTQTCQEIKCTFYVYERFIRQLAINKWLTEFKDLNQSVVNIDIDWNYS